MLINTLLGPTCACHIRTAVQTEELMSLRRLGQIRRMLNKVRPSIAAAQGQLTPEELAIGLRETTPVTVTARPVVTVISGDIPPVIS